MTEPSNLIKVTVVENASQKNVTGSKNWVAIKNKLTHVILEARTFPKNNLDEWKQIVWSGDKSEPVQGRPNRRKVALATSKKLHVIATFGKSKDYVDVWALWATIEVKTKGILPIGAAPFDPNTRDNSNKLGAVSYESMTASIIDEKAGKFVNNMGAAGKVVLVATLFPKGINKVTKSGFAFERQVWAHDWMDGQKTKRFNKIWTRDTSNFAHVRLVPNAKDNIFDTDAPDIRWGQKNYESYNNFRQWIEWNQTKCSDFVLWYWQARWRLHQDTKKQITLNDLNIGNIKLPTKPKSP